MELMTKRIPARFLNHPFQVTDAGVPSTLEVSFFKLTILIGFGILMVLVWIPLSMRIPTKLNES
jgi:hypothetical protein